MNQILCIFLILFIKISKYHNGNANMYLAMSNMEELLDAEKAMIDGLEQYIKIEEQKMNHLKSKFHEYQNDYTAAQSNTSDAYRLNPINAYLLTKHLLEDWTHVEDIIKNTHGKNIVESVVNNSSGIKFPTAEDLDGAAIALIRLQNVYNLKTEDIAEGLLRSIKFNKELTANDCFEVGKAAYRQQQFKTSNQWMNVALQKLPLQDKHNIMISRVEKADILEYLALATYREGDVKKALQITKELVELNPLYETARNNIQFYEKEIDEMSKDDGLNATNITKQPKSYQDMNIMERYEVLCRGEKVPTPSEESNLRCGYIDNDVPFLRIGPIKCEQVLADPTILIFHNVISDSEIENIKKLAKPKLDRALTFGDEKPKYRISKTSWLSPNEHKDVANVIRRAGLMTRLNMAGAEKLQVCNYGIGGQYEPHVDYSENPEAFEFDRTATILFYLTDVQQGGATVFTHLSRSVLPKKGSAVYWHNLYASGKGNIRTMHASCPVLTGSKWVANLWIHQTGQVCHKN